MSPYDLEKAASSPAPRPLGTARPGESVASVGSGPLSIQRPPRPKDPALASIDQQHAQVRSGYEAADKQVQDLAASRQKLHQIARPVALPLTEGPRGQVTRTYYQSDVPGAGRVAEQLDGRIAQATKAREAFAPQFEAITKQYQDFTNTTRANTIARQVGAPAGLMPELARPTAVQRAPSVHIFNPRRPESMSVRPPSPQSASAFEQPSDAPQSFINSRGQHATAPAGVRVTQDASGRPVFTATRESVGVGTAALAPPAAAAAAPAVGAAAIQRPSLPVANVQSSRSIIANPDEDRRRLEIALSGATFAPARSRGARAVQAQMVNGIFAQDQQRQRLEAQDANAALEANTRLATAAANEGGANYRAELEEAGQTARFGLQIRRPTYTTDAQGNYLSVEGSRATAVTDSAGSAIRMPKPEMSLSAKDILDSYDRQLASAPIGTEPAQWQAQVDASPLGQARAAMLARQWPLPPKVGTVKSGHRFSGGDPSDPKNWEPIK